MKVLPREAPQKNLLPIKNRLRNDFCRHDGEQFAILLPRLTTVLQSSIPGTGRQRPRQRPSTRHRLRHSQNVATSSASADSVDTLEQRRRGERQFTKDTNKVLLFLDTYSCVEKLRQLRNSIQVLQLQQDRRDQCQHHDRPSGGRGGRGQDQRGVGACHRHLHQMASGEGRRGQEKTGKARILCSRGDKT